MLARHRTRLLIGALVCIACSALAGSNDPADGILISSQSIALNPRNHKVYAVDTRGNGVWILDTRTASRAHVAVGAGPDALAINVLTGTVYVANSSGGSVSVLDGSTDTEIATIQAGPHPYILAVNEVTNRIYVTNTFSDLLAVIDGNTNRSTFLKLGSADAIAVDSRRNRVFLVGYEDPNLRVLNGATGSLDRIPISRHHWGMALNETSGVVYLTQTGDAEVVAVDPVSKRQTRIRVGAIPSALALNPQTSTLFVANYGDDSASIIDGTRAQAVATLKVGKRPQAVAVDAERNLAYIANFESGTVTVVDGAKRKVVDTLTAGKNPYGVVVDPGDGKLYVNHLGSPPVMILAP